MGESAPAPGGPAPDTVLEALAIFEAEGYTESFQIAEGSLHCAAHSEVQSLDVAIVEGFYRFEGESDPDDEAIVFALQNPETGTKGTLVSGFGPSADPETMDALIILHQRAAGPS